MVIARRKTHQKDVVRLHNLNNGRTLLGRATALEDHKRLLVALASGKYESVPRLLRASLDGHKSILTILELHDSAIQGFYSPKGYTEEDELRGILLWRLGGNRLAEIGHRALGLPGMTTLRNRSKVPHLISSHTNPTTSELQANIDACFDTLKEVLESAKVVHQVLMFDEIATEKRLRWDDKTNNFLGVCREHGKLTSLEFQSEDDMEEVFRSLEKDEVHYSTEVWGRFLTAAYTLLTPSFQ